MSIFKEYYEKTYGTGNCNKTKEEMKTASIQKQNDRQYSVDGVIVYKDMNGLWITTQELPASTIQQFHKHLNKERIKSKMSRGRFVNRVKDLRK